MSSNVPQVAHSGTAQRVQIVKTNQRRLRERERRHTNCRDSGTGEIRFCRLLKFAEREPRIRRDFVVTRNLLLLGAISFVFAIRGGQSQVSLCMKQIGPSGHVIIRSSRRFPPGYPFTKSSRPCQLQFFVAGYGGESCATLSWIDVMGLNWNYFYRLQANFYDAYSDVAYLNRNDIDPASRLMGGEFFNWILRSTLVDKVGA